MKIVEFNNSVFNAPNGFIHDWYTLAVRTGLYPKSLSYAYKNKHRMVSRINLKPGRVVYKSTGALMITQAGLRKLFTNVQSDPCMDQVWSYKKGLNVRSRVPELERSKWIVHFDIRKFFDTIEYNHIVETLQHFGYKRAGAKLIAKYATVYNRRKSTLQQGSKVSGEISNLVGYYFFDRHILKVLEGLKVKYPTIQYQYVRYCDNIYLAMRGDDTPMEMLKEYKAECLRIVHAARFKTHKWAFVPSNHPKRNQKVLGIIINAEARIETKEFERIRAMLFNACTTGFIPVVAEYYEKNPTGIFEIYTMNTRRTMQRAKFTSYIRGKIAYIGSISKKQGAQLKKLLGAAELLDAHMTSGIRGPGNTLPEGVFTVLKSYTQKDETIEAFHDRLRLELF